MFCSKCGTRLEEAARSCPLCGEPCRRQSTPPVSFDSGLVWAILTTVCCCQPFGIAAIVLACQASSYAAAGNFDAAEKAAKSSKRFSLIACPVFAGLIMLVILSQLLMFFVPFLLLLFAGAASNP